MASAGADNRLVLVESRAEHDAHAVPAKVSRFMVLHAHGLAPRRRLARSGRPRLPAPLEGEAIVAADNRSLDTSSFFWRLPTIARWMATRRTRHGDVSCPG